MMIAHIEIGGRRIGTGESVYCIAEVSANHNQNFEQAVRIVEAAKDAGADAVKLQTYTPDTITIQSSRECFQVGGGTLWDGRSLYDLYQEAYTPWDWQPKLKKVADDLGMHCFSSAFDDTAVDFLEKMNVPAHKIASFELVDMGLIRKMAATGKPLIMSTGMATLEEIEEAVSVARSAGGKQIALLKCTSAYPAPAEEMNLRTIPELARRFDVPAGLSDHTMGVAVPVAAVGLGACIIEKHLTLARAAGGPDSAFSLEPAEFKAMVDAVRVAEKALGSVHFGVSEREGSSRVFRRSLFVVRDVKVGEKFTSENVRSIRPGNGLHTRHLPDVLGKTAAIDVGHGTPLSWDLVSRK
jgi:N-acetylneuraminate synthase